MRRAAAILVVALAASGCGPRTVAVAPAAPSVQRSAQDRLRADLAALFISPRFERSFWSVLVRSADSPHALYELNGAKLMMPGSAMKIVTAAAAAEQLGWDYRFETRIVALAPVEAGVLRGDVFVVGGGDPGISERGDTPGLLRALAHQVREAGITRVEGGVVGDDDLYDDRGFGAGWTLDNIPYGYSAAVTALEYNEGSVDLMIRSGAAAGEPVAIQVRPEGGGLEIANRLVTVEGTGAGRLTLQRPPGSPRLVVEGQIPAGAAPFVRTASVDNPTRFFASAFRAALMAEGVPVAGDAIDIDDLVSKPDLTDARTLVSRQSAPLRQILSSMMKVSQNQYAELLLKAVGLERVREALRRWNIPDDSYVMADGSGLSRYNYVTSDALVRILQAMRGESDDASAFVESLPIAGRDGTLAARLMKTPAEGRVRAKTGTVDNVRAIAGYVETADGETLVFSMIANNFTVPSAEVDAAADQALIRLAAFSTQSQTGDAAAAAAASR